MKMKTHRRGSASSTVTVRPSIDTKLAVGDLSALPTLNLLSHIQHMGRIWCEIEFVLYVKFRAMLRSLALKASKVRIDVS